LFKKYKNNFSNIDIQKNLGFIFFTLALLLALLIRTYFMHGQVSDGQLYDTIARDLSNSSGSIWSPIWYTGPNSAAANGITAMSIPGGVPIATSFYEHPSFAIFLTSLFYKVFGGGIFVGKLYIFTTFVLNVFFVCLIWRRFFKTLSWHYLWIPILFWLFVPELLWIYKSNMIQNTEAVFSLCSSWLIFVSLGIKLDNKIDYRQDKAAFLKSCIFTILAATALFFAFLTNGLESLFPLGIYFAHWLVIRSESFWCAFFRSLLLFLVFVLVGVAFFYFIPDAYHNFYMYFKNQVLATLSGARGGGSVGWRRFYILYSVFQKLIPLIILSILFYYFYYKNKLLKDRSFLKSFINNIKSDKRIWFFMLIGFMASAPIVLTTRQHVWYTMQCFSYFLLGFLFILTPVIESFLDSNKYRQINNFKFKLFALTLFIISIIFVVFNAGKVYRDKKVFSDSINILHALPPTSTPVILGVSGKENWSRLMIYLQRYGKVYLSSGGEHKYYISSKGAHAPVGYNKVNIGTEVYDLYKLK
jgi:hypothetical protein